METDRLGDERDSSSSGSLSTRDPGGWAVRKVGAIEGSESFRPLEVESDNGNEWFRLLRRLVVTCVRTRW